MTNARNMASNATQKTAMESLRFGVEIETIGLSRTSTAETIRSVVGGTVVQRGGSYDKVVVVAPDGREWTAMRDASLSNPVHAEVVTPILTFADVETLQNIVRALRAAGARVDGSCGQHVHVEAAGLDGRKLGHLAATVYASEDLIVEALGVLPSRLQYCKLTSEETAKRLHAALSVPAARIAWYGSEHAANGAASMHYHQSRYAGLNLHSTFTRGTVEFRWFNATLHAGEVRANLMLCLALVAYATNCRSSRPKRAAGNLADKKWTMYRFLYHKLGLRGPSNEAVREHLTKRLPGSIESGSRRARTGGQGGSEGSGEGGQGAT